MASRDIRDLEPNTRAKAERFLILCAAADFDVLIYCTYRPDSEQAILYRQSRTIGQIKDMARKLSDVYGRDDLSKVLLGVGPHNGPHVTNAAPGQSLHGYGLAFDGVPMNQGKPVWSSSATEWQVYGELAETAGLSWAGNWIGFKEYPHCQQKNMRWKDLIQTGRPAMREA